MAPLRLARETDPTRPSASLEQCRDIVRAAFYLAQLVGSLTFFSGILRSTADGSRCVSQL